MTAAWLYATREIKRQRAGLLVLALVLAISAGVTMAGVAGARRTASAFDRLRAEASAHDAMVQYPSAGAAEATDPAVAEALRDLPGVIEVGEVRQLFLFVDDGEFDTADMSFGNLSTASVDGIFGRSMERGRLLEGSRPDPADPLAVSVSEGLASRFDLRPGDELAVNSLSFEQLECIFTGCPILRPEGPALALTVSGVERFVTEAFGPANPQQLLLTPAFVEEYGADVAGFGSLYAVRLADGVDGVGALTERTTELAERNGLELGDLFVDGALDDAVGIIDASRAMAIGLSVFAAVAAVAGLAVLLQTVARQLAVSAPDGPNLRAMGLTGRQRRVAALLVLVPAIVAGAIAAVIVAAALSTRFPLGQARTAEPAPGVDIDGYVLGIGFLATILVVGLVAFAVASSMDRRRARRRPSAVPAPQRLLAAASPPLATGARAALFPGASPTTSRVQALGGAVVAVIGVVGAVVFGAGLERFVGSAERDGWNWDLEVSAGDLLDEDGARAEAVEVAADPGIDGALVAHITEIRVEGDRFLTAFGTESVEGDLGLRLLAGREPSSEREVAVGALTARTMSVEIGDELTLDGVDGPVRYEVVGIARFPIIDSDAPDLGAWFTGTGLAAVAPPETGFPTILASLAPGASRAEVIDRLRADHTFVEGEPRRSSDTHNLDQMTGLPLLLALLAAALGAAALGHALFVGVGRRRRELALLRTVGFTARQLAATVVSHAVTLALVGLAVGIPLGIAVGHATWSALARSIGAADDPIVPAAVGLVAVLTLGLSLALAVIPALQASRVRASVELRRADDR